MKKLGFYFYTTLFALMLLSVSLISLTNCNTELEAYKRINQERGTIIVEPSDNKRYVTFRLRANSGLAFETEELRLALKSVKDVGNVRGVHLDGIRLFPDTLDCLNDLSTLETITLHSTGIKKEDVESWLERRRRVQSSRPDPKYVVE